MYDGLDAIVIEVLNEINQEKIIMKINPDQLSKDIDAIPEICKEGKDAIKKLFENNFDVKFKSVSKTYDFWSLQGKKFKVDGCIITTICFNLGSYEYIILINEDGKNRWCEPLTLRDFNIDVARGVYTEIK